MNNEKDNIIINSFQENNYNNNNAKFELENSDLNTSMNDEVIKKIPDWSIEPPMEIKRGNEWVTKNG